VPRGVTLALAALMAVGQEPTLEGAAQAARRAWLAHDLQALVAKSPSVVLQIPGADPSSPVGRPQAAELLRRYLASARERSLTIVTVREVESGRGFVELERRYVVRGTTDERRETVFLGFRRVEAGWVLTEVRSAALR
jgi:hypothetical protein